MHEHPARPASVPAEACWNAETESWEFSELDAQGQRSGDCRLYRSQDGSLLLSCQYVDGVKDGPFTYFHPNGELARRGKYEAGELEGEVVAYGCDAPSEMRLRSCCVPRGAWELRCRYSQGRLLRQVFYDRMGQPLASDGSLWPARPPELPEDVDFDESSQRWVVREEHSDTALERFFTVAGSIQEEVEYRHGARTRQRRFDAAGQLRAEHQYDAQGRLHGPSTRWFSNGSDSSYTDARICEERGQFWHGQAVGVFSLLDTEEQVLVRRDFGAGMDAAALSSSVALSAELDAATPERLWQCTLELQREGRVREAVCVAARAAAREGQATRLLSLIDSVSLPVEAGLAATRGETLRSSSDATLLGTLDELLLGTAPASVFHTLAALQGSRRVALDFVEAALLLAPDQKSMYLTRALVRLGLGDDRGVLEDAAIVASASLSVADHLRKSVRLVFPDWSRSWPPGEPLDPAPEGSVQVAPAQPLAAVQRQIRVYATRLWLLREAVRKLLPAAPEPAWLPPDLSSLLPDGPVELGLWTASITDEDDEGSESVEVTINERLDLAALSVSGLMCATRAEWAALCWLCWSVGLERVALPESITPASEFTAAVSMSLTRCFRAKDELQSGGLLAMSQGVPGFSWEGLDLTTLSPEFVRMVAAEYVEIRSMFLWLLFPENLSPYQSDIRRA